MNGARKDDTEWSSPDPERQMLHFLSPLQILVPDPQMERVSSSVKGRAGWKRKLSNRDRGGVCEDRSELIWEVSVCDMFRLLPRQMSRRPLDLWVWSSWPRSVLETSISKSSVFSGALSHNSGWDHPAVSRVREEIEAWVFLGLQPQGHFSILLLCKFCPVFTAVSQSVVGSTLRWTPYRSSQHLTSSRYGACRSVASSAASTLPFISLQTFSCLMAGKGVQELAVGPQQRHKDKLRILQILGYCEHLYCRGGGNEATAQWGKQRPCDILSPCGWPNNCPQRSLQETVRRHLPDLRKRNALLR